MHWALIFSTGSLKIKPFLDLSIRGNLETIFHLSKVFLSSKVILGIVIAGPIKLTVLSLNFNTAHDIGIADVLLDVPVIRSGTS